MRIVKPVVRKWSLILIAVVLMVSIVTMAVVVWIHNAQFPRVERPDPALHAGLSYADMENEYPRSKVGFYSGSHLLQGYIYGEENDLGLLVLAHGLGGGADSYLSHIRFFVDRGWRVFTYDATGSYSSEGRSTVGFTQSFMDLDAALSTIRHHHTMDRMDIVVYGHSWGGFAAASILHTDHPVAGVVSIAAANSSMDMLIEQGERMMGGWIRAVAPFLRIYQRWLFSDAAELTAKDAIESSDVPVFLIHGTQDEMFDVNGSAIVAHVQQNVPYVRHLLIDTPERNGHNNLFRSAESIEYLNEINRQYRQLYEEHDQNIPEDLDRAFYATIDRWALNELDADLMTDIHLFLKSCIDGTWKD